MGQVLLYTLAVHTRMARAYNTLLYLFIAAQLAGKVGYLLLAAAPGVGSSKVYDAKAHGVLLHSSFSLAYRKKTA